jgi:hypothetical protein
MLLSGSDILQVVSASAVTCDALVQYCDYNKGWENPGRIASAIVAAATYDICGPGGSSVSRSIEEFTIRNKHASSSNAVTIQLLLGGSGGTVYEIFKYTLLAGETLTYNEDLGFTISPTPSSMLLRPVEDLITTKVLVAADSGKILTLGLVGGFDTKLPAPAPGLFFDFVVKVAPTTAYTITSNGTTQNVIHGLNATNDVNSATDPDLTGGTAVDVITFVANKALIGDRVQALCDGTLWYAIAYSNVFDAITFS